MTNNEKPWALITGANGGIGQALVAEFIECGYRVIATDISTRTESAHENVVFLQIDLQQFVLSEEYAKQFAKNISDITNNVGISALINNAAVQILDRCENLSREQWQNSFNVNLSAPFFMVQAFLPELTRNQGSVVNISSIHATQTKKEFVAYATTKAGLSALTRNLAIDLGVKVRVNAIEPAAVGTDMLRAGFNGKEDSFKQLEKFHPMERIALPQEVAELAVFLCSKKANFVHGACISASGGIQGCLSDPS
jgi:NAD(P)-dependent dehydrogenase (short-subunit alcohol dehydrogenase family)